MTTPRPTSTVDVHVDVPDALAVPTYPLRDLPRALRSATPSRVKRLLLASASPSPRAAPTRRAGGQPAPRAALAGDAARPRDDPPAPVPPSGARPTRPPAPRPVTAPPPTPVTFAAVGDVMLGSSFPDETGGLLPPDDGAGLLAEVAPLLSAADVAFVQPRGAARRRRPLREVRDVEARPLLRLPRPDPLRQAPRRRRRGRRLPREQPRRRLRRRRARELARATSTRSASATPARPARWRASTSAAPDRASSRSRPRPARTTCATSTRRARDRRRRAAGTPTSSSSRCTAAPRAPIASTCPPGHESFLGEDRGDLRAFARAVVDAGADSRHRPRPARRPRDGGRDQGRLVVYSLGNFATYGGMNLSGPNGLTAGPRACGSRPTATFLGGTLHAARQERPGGPRSTRAAR